MAPNRHYLGYLELLKALVKALLECMLIQTFPWICLNDGGAPHQQGQATLQGKPRALSAAVLVLIDLSKNRHT